MNLKLSFIILTAGLLSFSGSSVCHAQSKEGWPAVTKEMKPWTRWWWLGNAVDQEGLTFRLEEMNKAGFGGVEITPIYGTKGFESKFIDFLSPQWMKMLNHTISEGNRLGMGVDMNTGTGWPFGGPEVSVENAASKVILQTYSLDSGEKLKEPVVVNEKKQKDVAVLQVLMAFSNSGDRINITDKVDNNGNLNWTAPRGKWKLIAAFNGKSFQQVKRAAPGGQGPVMDHFSAKAVDSYLNKFTQAFQSSSSPVPHNFFNDSYEVYGADWSKNFFDEFAKYRGYRLENYLLEFMGEGDADIVSRVVSDYRETISDMLLHNFTLNWTGWAHKMGSQTRNQAHGSPGNLIDLYGTVDVPECESFGSTYFDIPGLRWDGREGSNSLESNYLMMKFSSSAAHISGHPLSSSETFTWLTEHFKTALSQCKPQVDMMLLTGINHVVYHGTPYSPKDAPWPGWLFYASVDFSSYNTIWKDIRPMNEYIARCQSFLQNGSPDNDFLVYWPVYDTWYNIKGKPFYAFTIGQTLNEWLVPTSFYRTASKLHEKGYGFDYISDHFLADAKVENGRVKTQGASYKVLVVPSCRLMPVETMRKIISLINEGAKVAFVDNFAQDVPGLHNFDARRQQLISLVLSFPEHSFVNMGKVTKMGKGTLITGSNIDKLVDLCGVKRETVVDDGIQYIRRSNPEGFHYFFANLQSKALDGWVTLGVDAVSAQIFDPLTGKTGL
ncbi:MAG: glycosyl hydrolase, partial [Bacteroidota bacterium]|nr:glycosyl hydrolase [Bacteroidota bacterium]